MTPTTQPSPRSVVDPSPRSLSPVSRIETVWSFEATQSEELLANGRALLSVLMSLVRFHKLFVARASQHTVSHS